MVCMYHVFQISQGEEGVANDDLEWEVKIEDQVSSQSSTQELRDSCTPSPDPGTLPQRRLSKRLRGHSKLDSGDDTDSLEREKVTLLKQVVSHAFAPEDSADIFGKFVASKMREITNPVERLRAEHSITGILYSALSRPSQLENNVMKTTENTYPISPTTQTIHPNEGQQPYQLLVQIQPSLT